jgi:hypothetical protein
MRGKLDLRKTDGCSMPARVRVPGRRMRSPPAVNSNVMSMAALRTSGWVAGEDMNGFGAGGRARDG